MNQPYLEVTFRHGKALAAYFYLPRRPTDRSSRTEVASPGLVVDFPRAGKAIGVEITAPQKVTLTALNKVLRKLGSPAVKRAELAPLRVA